MNRIATIPILTLLAAAPVAPGNELPVTFARCGMAVPVRLQRTEDQPAGTVVLRVYGSVCGEPAPVDDSVAELKIPEVRVPVVFRVTPENNRKREVAEVVAYPDRSMPWDKETVLLSAGTPAWFDQWAAAVGLPVEKVTISGMLKSGRPRKLRAKRALLVVGCEAAGKELADFLEIVRRCRINVLILKSDWFGRLKTFPEPFRLEPHQAAGRLAELQTQRWPRPPIFGRHSLPFGGVLNRQAWIAGKQYPLLEEIRPQVRDVDSLRIVLSYLPWHRQLGRCEVADELFARLLAASGQAVEDRKPLCSRLHLLYPDADTVEKSERPVLAAALAQPRTKPATGISHSGFSADNPAAYVLDLRGNVEPPRQLAKTLEAIESRIDAETPLLILGDDSLTDRWTWLKARRKGKHRQGVARWSDDTLPPSPAMQLRLMQFLTRYHIPLQSGDEP